MASKQSNGAKDGEFDLIKRLFAPFADAASAGDLQDDAARFTPPPAHDLVISTDALVSGVHFPDNAAPEMVAARLVGANVSDLAAQGAMPVGCVLTLCIGPDWDDDFLDAFAAAFKHCLARFDMPLWGGDTVRGAQSLVSLTVHGIVPQGEMLARAGARPDQDVYVTGTIGDGYLGLHHALNQTQGASLQAYAAPNPPIGFAQQVRQLCSAAIDVSDGLAGDLDHICEASSLAMRIEAAQVPLSPEGAAVAEAGDLASLLTGGDDYQLVLCADTGRGDEMAAIADKCGVRLTCIGRTVAAQKGAEMAEFYDAEGHLIDLPTRGYRHF